MLTKLLLLLFAGSILPTYSSNEYGDFYSEYNRRPQKIKVQYTSQVWDQGELNEGRVSRKTHQNARTDLTQSDYTKVRPKSEDDLHADASAFSISSLIISGLQNRFSSQDPPVTSRAPTYADIVKQPKPTLGPGYVNSGNVQLTDPIQTADPVLRQPTVQYVNGQYPGDRQNIAAQPANLQPQTFNVNEGSYYNSGQLLTTNTGTNYQAGGQNRIKPDDAQFEVQPLEGPGASPLALSAMQSGIDMMRLLGREIKGNTVISPTSISIVLSALQQGARGASQQELTQFLQSNSATSGRKVYDFISSVKTTRGNTIKIANAVFVNHDFNLNNDFKTLTSNNFRADVTPVNFQQPAGAAKSINSWVKDATSNLIPGLVDSNSLDTSTQLLLANAIYFKGIWNTTFSKERTVPRVFGVYPGVNKNVAFMHQSGQFRAGDDAALDAKWLFLPFLNLEFNMLLILPNEEFGLDQMMDRLTPAALDHIIRDQTFREVVMGIPKFKLSLETDLAGTLARLNLKTIFGHTANLSGLGTSSNNEPLYVSKVLHKATIEIDEQGSTAAAVTGLAVNTLSLASYNDEFRFTANHPFLVLLLDKGSSAPLFMARVVDPLEG